MSVSSDRLIAQIKQAIEALAQPDGGFKPSPQPDYLGIADSKVSDFAAAVYAAEIAQTLDFKLPYHQRTMEFIKARQTPQGYFTSLNVPQGVNPETYFMYNTCIGVRGLKAFNQSPAYDPRPYYDTLVREMDETQWFYPYLPDFYANTYAALEETMPEDCFEKLGNMLLARQDNETGFIIQRPENELQRQNPMSFHAARFFHLHNRVIPMADKMLATFMKLQEEDNSWKRGNVHGTFDACVAIRILSDNSPKYQHAIDKAGQWALTCQQPDGLFNHFNDDKPAELDASYFHVGSLVMAGILPSPLDTSNRWIGWGHTLKNTN